MVLFNIPKALLAISSALILSNVLMANDLNTSTPTAKSDFYHWVNDPWFKENPIPSDKVGINNFVLIQDKVNKDILTLLEGLKTKKELTKDESKLLILYKSFLDQKQIDSLGLNPLEKELSAIRAAKSHKDIALQFVQLQKLGVLAPITYTVAPDFKNNEKQIMILAQAGLGLERINYLAEDPYSQKERALYLETMTRLFSLASIPEAEKKAKDVLELEQKIAKIQWSNVENRNPNKSYNLYTYSKLLSTLNNLAFADQIKVLGAPKKQSYNVMQPSYVINFNTLFKENDTELWKLYLQSRLLFTYAKLLDSRFKNCVTEYDIKRGLYDKEEQLNLQAVRYLNNNVGMLLGKSYVQTYFDESIKKDLVTIVHNIVNEYRIAIENSPRMTTKTKQKALEKLEKMTFKIGHPDRWKDYSSLLLKEGELVENHKKISRFEHAYMMHNLGKPVDKNEWGYPPQEINAFYEPSSNSFVLLAGILHDPFYSKSQTAAQKYGSIGFVIGHEIGHGFDDQGSQFDAKGNLVNWWQLQDSKQFDVIKANLIAQADSYEILPGKYLNGALEVGEIIGDLSGAEISLKAYAKIAKAQNIPLKQAYEEYFIQLAKTWRDHLRVEFLKMLIDKDVHPASEFRTNGIVKNMDQFYETFGIQPSDPMYLSPEKRVRIW